jgi:hypothetical protein
MPSRVAYVLMARSHRTPEINLERPQRQLTWRPVVMVRQGSKRRAAKTPVRNLGPFQLEWVARAVLVKLLDELEQ